MKAIKTIIIVLLIVVTVILGIRLLTPEDTWICQNGTWQQHGRPDSPMPTTPCVNNEEKISPSLSISPTSVTNNFKDYQNTRMGFSVKIPDTTSVTENIDNTITFSKWGPTQKTQTELYDGYSINIDLGSLGANKDLKSLVEADIEQKKQQLSPDFKILVAPIPYLKDGYYYESEEMFGDVAYYYVAKTSEKFLLISVMIKDPGKLGFKEEVGNIISGITITK